MNNITYIQTKDWEFEILNRHLLENEIEKYKYFVEAIITDEQRQELNKMKMKEIRQTVSGILSGSVIEVN